MYAVIAAGKEWPYGLNNGPLRTPWLFLPPWRGPILPPAEPDRDGHFDHIPVEDPRFAAAHGFAVARLTLDVWERYLGHPVEWHFAAHFSRLEICLLPGWANGQFGYGYLEVGAPPVPGPETWPFALTLDVIAHEVGHGIIYATIGLPQGDEQSGEYYGFHESAADWVALLVQLHLGGVIEDLLVATRGNLYTYNFFNRFAELSPTTQVRMASNYLKMSDFAAGFTDEHQLAQPLTGAVFDIFVDLYHELLVADGLIDREAEELSDLMQTHPELEPQVQREFNRAFLEDPEGFHEALRRARHLLGTILAGTWQRLSAPTLSYAGLAEAMLESELAVTHGRFQDLLRSNFEWREIGSIAAGPRLEKPTETSHTLSSRTLAPWHRRNLPSMSYRERYLISCRCRQAPARRAS